MKKQILTLVVILFASNFTFAECLERHGAMDFGSGTTKAIVAQVDICQKKIVKILFEDRLPLALNEAMEKAGGRTIPEDVVAQAYPQLEKMRDEMKKFEVKKISGVATAVFRVAKNGKAIVTKLSKDLKIPIQIISQQREAELGYWSALAQKETLPSPDFIVWDIGGGSMQMYAQGLGKAQVYEGSLASVSFKNTILEVLQFKSPKEHSSPNPLGRNKEAAVQLAKNHAVLHVPAFFKKQADEARWVGVGGVLAMSVQKQVDKKASEFSQDQLAQVLDQRALLKDDEIKSDYRISDVSNLALVLGYMKALNIKKVETAQASLGQGLIYQALNSKDLK